jgi:hypothetical protein
MFLPYMAMYVHMYVMYVCMYVCMYKGWATKSSPCTATFNDLLCFPFLIDPLLIPHLE